MIAERDRGSAFVVVEQVNASLGSTCSSSEFAFRRGRGGFLLLGRVLRHELKNRGRALVRQKPGRQRVVIHITVHAGTRRERERARKPIGKMGCSTTIFFCDTQSDETF